MGEDKERRNEVVRQEFRDGATIEELAERHQISIGYTRVLVRPIREETAAARVARNKKIVRAVARGRPAEAIAKEHGVSVTRVYAIARGEPSPTGGRRRETNLTPEEVAEMQALRAADVTLQAIGDRFGVTRERVRQLTTGGSAETGFAAVRRRTAARKEAAMADGPVLADMWRAGLTAKEIADRTPYFHDDVMPAIRPHIDVMEKRWRAYDRPHGSQIDWPYWLRRYAEEHGGKTPGITMFRRWKNEVPERPEPSGAMQRYGSWNAAIDAAGLKRNRPLRRTYTRDFTFEDCLAAIDRCWDDLGHAPSFEQYDAWAKERKGEVPSTGTVRNRAGDNGDRRWLPTLDIVSERRKAR